MESTAWVAGLSVEEVQCFCNHVRVQDRLGPLSGLVALTVSLYRVFDNLVGTDANIGVRLNRGGRERDSRDHS